MGRPRIIGAAGDYNANDNSTSGLSDPNWHPTVTFLVLLVIAEYAALAGLRYFFRTVHGG